MEAPDLVELYEEYKDRLDIYAVNATQLDNETDVRKFAERFRYPFPVLLDPDNEIVDTYLVNGYPTSFIVDKHGVIREVIVGIRPKEELERMLRKVM